MSKHSMSTELIHAWQQARRSRKRVGSVACSEQGERSETIFSRPFVRTSRVWLRCNPKDETQWGVKHDPMSHDGLGDISTFVKRVTVRSCNRHGRRAESDSVNGVQSRPNHDASSHSVNMGSPKLAGSVNTCLYGDGVPILPKSQPVMGVTAGNQSGSASRHKSPAMATKPEKGRGKVEQFLCSVNPHERRIASAFR